MHDLEQSFQLMKAQNRRRRDEVPSTTDVDLFWAEVMYMIDPLREGGHYSFKRVIVENREQAVELLKT